MKKKNYESPEAELFTVRAERNIMSPVYGQKNQAGLYFTDDYILDQDVDF